MDYFFISPLNIYVFTVIFEALNTISFQTLPYRY